MPKSDLLGAISTAALRRMLGSGVRISDSSLTNHRALHVHSISRQMGRFSYRQISHLVKPDGKRAFLVDTLALVRGLEAQGLPTKQAEAITSAITQVLNDSMENVSHLFVTKAELQKVEMMQESNLSKFTSELQKVEMAKESNLSKFKSELQSSQEHHFSVLQREIEKFRGDLEKMRSESRYEIDKVTAGQRLDLNLEKGRIRDELANQSAETNNLTNKLDKEIHSLRAQVEAAKYEVIKYCIGTIVSLVAVGLAVLRILPEFSGGKK